MAEQKNNRKVTAIVPAYNEAQRIGTVLQILCRCSSLDEIIVVDDGSHDDIEKVVGKFPVRFVRLQENGGKGKAMDRGVAESQNEVIFFCDADIKGLTPQMVEEIVTPVKSGEVDMFIAMRNRKTFVLRFLLAFIPLLGGERAVTKSLWQKVPDFYKDKFRIEAGLNFYAKYHGKGFRFKVFVGLSQTIKEKKYGFWKGLNSRVKMMWDYTRAQLSLEFMDLPKSVVSRRLFLLKIVSTLFFLGIGAFIFVAVYFGPRQFLLDIFSERLSTDPSTPIIHSFLWIASTVSIDILLVSAAVIVLTNGIILAANITNLIRVIYNYSMKWRTSVLSQIHISPDEIKGEKKEISL